MKICFLAPKVYPLFNTEIAKVFGGAEVQISLLAKALAKESGHRVAVIVADYGQPECEVREGVELWRSFSFDQPLLFRIVRFIYPLRKVKADIYVQRTFHPLMGLLVLYGALFRHPFVYMVASDGEADGTHSMYRSTWGRISIALVLRFSTLIIAQNEDERDNLQQRSATPCVVLKKGLTVHEPVHTEKVYDGIWIARCVSLKKPEVFLALARNNPDRKFLMICPEATDERKYFEEVRDMALQVPNIDFRPFTRHSEIAVAMRKCRIFCLTSLSEGDWPNTVVEAAAEAVPILTLTIRHKDLVEEYGGALYCDDDAAVFDQKFKLLLADQAMREQVGRNALAWVKENHDIAMQSKRLLDMLLKQHQQRPALS